MDDTDPSNVPPMKEDVDTVVYVYDDRVLLMGWTQSGEAVEALICHDRASTMTALEQRLHERDPAGLEETLAELEQQTTVPLYRHDVGNFVFPESLLRRFNELHVLGLSVCEAAKSDDPDDVLEKLLGDNGYLYNHVIREDAMTYAAFIIYIDEDGAAAGFVIESKSAIDEAMRAISHAMTPDTHDQLTEIFQGLSPDHETPLYRLNEVMSALLLVGRMSELHLEQQRVRTRTLH